MRRARVEMLQLTGAGECPEAGLQTLNSSDIDSEAGHRSWFAQKDG